jgi:hypothetical protein
MGTGMKHLTQTTGRFEEINRWLDLQGDMGIADGDEKPSLRSIIMETVARLPDDVYSALVRNRQAPHLLFAGCGPGQRAQAVRRNLLVPAGFRDRFIEDLIVLSNELCGLPLEEACGIVAHEIAHVILGHTGRDPLADYERKENEAEALIISWGFAPSKRPPD